MKRRSFIKGTVAAGIAAGTGIVPTIASAKNMTEAKSMDAVLAALDATGAAESSDIMIKAPEIAENGAVVPVEVKSNIPGTTEIHAVIAKNPTPYAAGYTIGEGAQSGVKTRFKMGQTSDFVALVKADGKFHTAKTEIKVTKGGCGG